MAKFLGLTPAIQTPLGTKVYEGTGAPEGAQTATAGSLYVRVAAAAEFYLKASGSGNTGWLRLYPIVVGTSTPSDTTALWLDTN